MDSQRKAAEAKKAFENAQIQAANNEQLGQNALIAAAQAEEALRLSQSAQSDLTQSSSQSSTFGDALMRTIQADQEVEQARRKQKELQESTMQTYGSVRLIISTPLVTRGQKVLKMHRFCRNVCFPSVSRMWPNEESDV